MPTQCYMLEPTRRARLSLRRYSSNSQEGTCPINGWYHNGEVFLVEVPETYEYEDQAKAKIYRHGGPQDRSEVSPDANWPTHCACGYQFQETDQWQVFSDHLYRRSDTGAIITLDEAGPGAMWNAEYLEDNPDMVGPDGMSLHVNCPNGVPWSIDGRCNNCDSPCANCGQPYYACQGNCPTGYKDSRPHKCWLRSGTPPMITVGKTGGDGITCGAGGGSIQAGDYHGFLQNGSFT